MNPLILILGAGAALIVAFWPKILQWSQNHLFPWLKKHFPGFYPYVRDAFMYLDEVAVNIRRSVKTAWKKLRTVLLGQVVRINKVTNSKIVKTVTSWLIKHLKGNEKVPVKVQSEQELTWDELPQDIREKFMRNGGNVVDTNVSDIRDKELQYY